MFFLSISLIITRLVSKVRKQAEEALSSVSHKVVKAEEQEYHRIAADLHEGNSDMSIFWVPVKVETIAHPASNE